MISGDSPAAISAENPPKIRLIVAVCAVLVCITVVLGVKAAFASLSEHGLRAAPNSKLTQAYTSTLAAGQSHLQQTPDPSLLALPNPYDPAKNGVLGLLDVSRSPRPTVNSPPNPRRLSPLSRNPSTLSFTSANTSLPADRAPSASISSFLQTARAGSNRS